MVIIEQVVLLERLLRERCSLGRNTVILVRVVLILVVMFMRVLWRLQQLQTLAIPTL